MAAATPVTPASGLRGVRDKYLALLLSDVQTHATNAIPAVPLTTSVPNANGGLGMNASNTPSTWTPGGKFPFTSFTPNTASTQQQPPQQQQQPLWTSPVTPMTNHPPQVSHSLPTATDADVRLAELTAGLVAANDNENRQAEAIRRLSGQLERTERQLRLYQRTRVPPRPSSFPSAVVNGHSNPNRTSHHHAHLPPPSVPVDIDEEHINEFEQGDQHPGHDRHEHRRSYSHRQSEHNYDPNSPQKPTRPPPSSSRRRRRTELHAVDDVEPVPLDRSQGVRRQSTRPDGRGRGRTGSPQRDAGRPISRGKRDGVRLSFEEASPHPMERTPEKHKNTDHNESENRRLQAQLKDLQMKELQRKVEQYEKEIGLFSKVFADVKKGQQRLLNERAVHLNLIARQRELLANSQTKTPRNTSAGNSDDLHFKRRDDLSAASYSPRRRSSSPVSDRQSRRASSNDAGRTQSEQGKAQRSSASASSHEVRPSDGKQTTTTARRDERSIPENEKYNTVEELIRDDETVSSSTGEGNFDVNGSRITPREAALAEELRIVLQENAALHERMPQLENHCQQLERRLMQLENLPLSSKESAGENGSNASPEPGSKSNSGMATNATNRDRRKTLDPDRLHRLVEEVDVLEGVAEAIRFGTGVATGMTTATNLGMMTVDSMTMTSLGERPTGAPKNGDNVDDADVLVTVADRVARIRSSLSIKYGQWLEAVGHQTVTATCTQNISKSSRASRDNNTNGSRRSKHSDRHKSARNSTSTRSVSSTSSSKRPSRGEAAQQEESSVPDEPMNTEIIEQLVNS